jgi:hypothetical protein
MSWIPQYIGCTASRQFLTHPGFVGLTPIKSRLVKTVRISSSLSFGFFLILSVEG